MVPSSDSDLFHLSSAFLLQLHPDEILRMPQIPMLHCMDFFHPLSFRYMLRILHRYVAYQRNPDEIFNLFKSTFENVVEPYSINEVHFQQKDGGITTQVISTFNGKTITTEATGNGRLDAVSNALKKAYEMKFTLVTYQEHALEKSSSSKAIAYVGIQKPDGTLSWGAGVDPDIIRASIDALVTAINNR